MSDNPKLGATQSFFRSFVNARARANKREDTTLKAAAVRRVNQACVLCRDQQRARAPIYWGLRSVCPLNPLLLVAGKIRRAPENSCNGGRRLRRE